MPSLHLPDVICTCARGCLAAQRYIATELLRVQDLPHNPSPREKAISILELDPARKQCLLSRLHATVGVEVKSVLNFKEGGAAKDLVTTADVLTQALLVRLLLREFPDAPFTIIGEEAAPNATLDAIARRCVEAEGWKAEKIPGEAALRAHLPRWKGAARLHAASVEELRERVGVFIDPIDATNCFAEGVWEAPMTLVGVAVDGVPVGGVVNRLFAFPVSAEGPSGGGFSYILNPAQNDTAFIVHEGRLVGSPREMGEEKRGDAPLRVCESPTTKSAFLREVNERLRPCAICYARGSGNKEFFLLHQALGGARAGADVFVAPSRTIMAWDCCAPHAFLRALGGEIYTLKGTPLRYRHRSGDEALSAALAELPDGVVAVTAAAKEEVARRMGWAARDVKEGIGKSHL
ncbi:unnamed protein product [Phytomonas sp. EM1]|nr:unnamed protein product [Phytomonas sp. EM1]|eukprot:CCW65451.1 unnamed protein product [Phytomonas sp. isolate EM1]